MVLLTKITDISLQLNICHTVTVKKNKKKFLFLLSLMLCYHGNSKQEDHW